MLKYKFPYCFKLKFNGKVSCFPSLQVSCAKQSKEISLLLLVDSGAETTLLTASDADLLGINLEDGTEVMVNSISPVPLQTFRHKIKIEIGESKFEIPVLFANSDESPRVLGREGIFERFFIIFDEKNHQTIFIPHNPNARKKMQPILND